MTIETTVWGVGPFKIITKTSNSSYGIRVFCSGKQIHFSKFGWGPSKCDALAMAVYKNDPACCQGLMNYLFKRIDFYADGPSFLDAWPCAKVQP